MAIRQRERRSDAIVFPDPQALPWRIFKDRPSGLFVDQIASQIREHGSPEVCDGIYRSKLPKDARYRILRRIDIDRHKRPNYDMAPCPMCGTKDKFLKGSLAWLYDLQCAAVIGHCCADNVDEAEREFKASETLKAQEDYLLQAIPMLTAKAATLQSLKGAAEEAQTLYRKFRKQAGALHQQLRAAKERAGNRLILTELLSGNEEGVRRDYVGPSGFKGSSSGGSNIESRDHDFGILDGATALLKDYSPVRELDYAIRAAAFFNLESNDEEAVINLVAGMNDRVRYASVANCQAVDSYYEKFRSRLTDFCAFWHPSNIERLNAYGTSPLNPAPFDAIYKAVNGRPLIILRSTMNEARVMPSAKLRDIERAWTAFTYAKPGRGKS